MPRIQRGRGPLKTAQLAFNNDTDHTDPYEQYTNSSGSILTDVTFQSDGNVTTNILDLQSITIQKIWEDNNNQWNTRPNPTGDYTWETSFVVQKKNGNNWENVQVYTDEIAQDLVVTLRGGNEDTEGGWTAAITGLPAGEYRIRELQPGWNEDDQITAENTRMLFNTDTGRITSWLYKGRELVNQTPAYYEKGINPELFRAPPSR